LVTAKYLVVKGTSPSIAPQYSPAQQSRFETHGVVKTGLEALLQEKGLSGRYQVAMNFFGSFPIALAETATGSRTFLGSTSSEALVRWAADPLPIIDTRGQDLMDRGWLEKLQER